MVNRIDSLIAEPTERRRATAVARVDPLLRDLHPDGIDIVVINGIEDVMLNLANDIDGYVPTGESAHQDTKDFSNITGFRDL